MTWYDTQNKIQYTDIENTNNQCYTNYQQQSVIHQVEPCPVSAPTPTTLDIRRMESRHGGASLVTLLLRATRLSQDQQLPQEQEQKQEQEHWQNHLWDHPHTFPLKNKWLLPQSNKPLFLNLTPKIYTTALMGHTINHHHKPLLDIINRGSRFLLLRSDPVPTTTLKSHKHQSSKICHHSTQVYTPRT